MTLCILAVIEKAWVGERGLRLFGAAGYQTDNMWFEEGCRHLDKISGQLLNMGCSKAELDRYESSQSPSLQQVSCPCFISECGKILWGCLMSDNRRHEGNRRGAMGEGTAGVPTLSTRCPANARQPGAAAIATLAKDRLTF